MILKTFATLLCANYNAIGLKSSGIVAISGTTPSTDNPPQFHNSCYIVNYAGGNTSSTTNTTTTSYQFRSISLTFGSGTTEPTANDYQMESPYDTTSHFSWQSQTKSGVIDSLTTVITASIASISEEDLSISEIGVVYSANDGASNNILIARSLISPITISYGETKTFQYTLDFTGLAG